MDTLELAEELQANEDLGQCNRSRVAEGPRPLGRHGRDALARISGHQRVFIPLCRGTEFNTFHTFVIHFDRHDELCAYLVSAGVGTGIHYPVLIHLQPAASELVHGTGDFPVCERLLALPVNQSLGEEDTAYAAAHVNRFFVFANLPIRG